MVKDIPLLQLRNDTGEIMRRLARGRSDFVTRNGMPVGELTPLRRHRLVSPDTGMARLRGAPAANRPGFAPT